MENKYLLPVEHTAQQHKKSVLDIIPLPGKEDGYARGTLVGASGAGKPSLLRFLAGTAKEKSPAVKALSGSVTAPPVTLRCFPVSINRSALLSNPSSKIRMAPSPLFCPAALHNRDA